MVKDMKTRTLNHKIIHWTIRLIVLAGLLDLFLDFTFSPKYYDFFRRASLADVMFAWFAASPVILISATALESWWMRGSELERRALAIDWFLVIAYIGACVFALLYTVTHSVWL